MPSPLVSIVIPVYNGFNYIRQAINSALTQTYANTEIIVVNDGSTDNTEELCMGYSDKIRYFKKENGGVASALNLGIAQMRGEYFSWLSHDDLYHPDKLEKQIDALYRCGDMSRIVYGDFEMLDQDTGSLRPRRLSELYSVDLLSDSVFPVMIGLLSGCAMLIHRSHFDRVGTFKPELRYTQDYDLWFRMLRNQKLVYIDSPAYILRAHGAQETKTASKKMHVEEAALWLHITRSLSHSEATRMFGSPYEFYRKMYIRQTAYGDDEAIKETMQLLLAHDAPVNIAERINLIRGHIEETGGGIKHALCIFCTGVYGHQLFYELKLGGIQIDYFADNDPSRHGATIAEGIPCLSFAQLSEMKNDTVVIVANRFPDAIVEQLRNAGFPFVTTKQAIDRILEL